MGIFERLFRFAKFAGAAKPLAHTAPQTSTPLPHNHRPGWSGGLFGIVLWLLDVKEGLACIREPYRYCQSLGDVFNTTLDLSMVTFAGVVVWLVVVVCSTIVLIIFLRGKLKFPISD